MTRKFFDSATLELDWPKQEILDKDKYGVVFKTILPGCLKHIGLLTDTGTDEVHTYLAHTVCDKYLGILRHIMRVAVHCIGEDEKRMKLFIC